MEHLFLSLKVKYLLFNLSHRSLVCPYVTVPTWVLKQSLTLSETLSSKYYL